MLCSVVKKIEEQEVKNVEVNVTTTKVPARDEDTVVTLVVEVAKEEKQCFSVLPTAIIHAKKADGCFDSAGCSQTSLVTEAFVQKLPPRNGKLVVNSLGHQEMETTRGLVSLRIASRFNNNVVLTTEAYILGKLTTTIRSQRFNCSNMKLLNNLGELADSQFNRPSAMDIMLGADVFLALLKGRTSEERKWPYSRWTVRCIRNHTK